MYQRHLRLDKLIPAALTRYPLSSALDLHQRISQMRKCSLQAVYKMLRSLESDGVIVKMGELYMLRFAWVMQLHRASGEMLKQAFGAPYLRSLLPAVGERRQWKLSSLHQAGPFGTQVLLVLLEQTGVRDYYEYSPHAYFYFANASSEAGYFQALSLADRGYYLLVGADTPLDREYERVFCAAVKRGAIHFTKRVRVVHPQRHYAVIGDYVVTTYFGVQLIQQMSALYRESVRNLNQVVPRAVQVVTQPTSLRLVVEHSAKKAELLRGYLSRYFSLSTSPPVAVTAPSRRV